MVSITKYKPEITLFSVLLIMLAGLFLLSLALGSVRIPLDQLLLILTGRTPDKLSWVQIVLLFRLPKAITAVLAGSALGVAGLQMQTLFRNPLADPFVLGISSGASLGVALVVMGFGVSHTMQVSTFLSGLSGLGHLGVAVSASLGAGIVLLLILLMSQRVSTMTLLILGLMIGYGVSAIVSVLIYFSIAEQVQAYIAWTFGSFGGTTWAELQVMIPVVLLGLVFAGVSAKTLNALLLGESYAQSLGTGLKQARYGIIVSSALLAGVVTAFCGPIGFLGIAVPHLCRNIFSTADHRRLIPASILTGGIIALIADLVAGVPGQNIILPLNAITALIGAPVVISILLRRQQISST